MLTTTPDTSELLKDTEISNLKLEDLNQRITELILLYTKLLKGLETKAEDEFEQLKGFISDYIKDYLNDELIEKLLANINLDSGLIETILNNILKDKESEAYKIITDIVLDLLGKLDNIPEGLYDLNKLNNPNLYLEASFPMSTTLDLNKKYSLKFITNINTGLYEEDIFGQKVFKCDESTFIDNNNFNGFDTGLKIQNNNFTISFIFENEEDGKYTNDKLFILNTNAEINQAGLLLNLFNTNIGMYWLNGDDFDVNFIVTNDDEFLSEMTYFDNDVYNNSLKKGSHLFTFSYVNEIPKIYCDGELLLQGKTISSININNQNHTLRNYSKLSNGSYYSKISMLDIFYGNFTDQDAKDLYNFYSSKFQEN